ncbi:unnamed protein product, partial [Prorocentrum cordatum]
MTGPLGASLSSWRCLQRRGTSTATYEQRVRDERVSCSIVDASWAAAAGTGRRQARESHLQNVRIPEGVDLLVTHVPPYGVRDLCYHGGRAGSWALRKVVQALPRERRPKAWLFGHIHEAHGASWLRAE